MSSAVLQSKANSQQLEAILASSLGFRNSRLRQHSLASWKRLRDNDYWSGKSPNFHVASWFLVV